MIGAPPPRAPVPTSYIHVYFRRELGCGVSDGRKAYKSVGLISHACFCGCPVLFPSLITFVLAACFGHVKKVMDASGQTVEERRQLRLEQRNLRSVIIEQQAVRAGRDGEEIVCRWSEDDWGLGAKYTQNKREEQKERGTLKVAKVWKGNEEREDGGREEVLGTIFFLCKSYVYCTAVRTLTNEKA